MAKKKVSKENGEVKDYRHKNSKRKNIPSAGIDSHGKIKEEPKIQYEYNPHLYPTLRFDDSGKADKLPELLATAQKRALNEDELAILAEALKKNEPWLEWTGKREKKFFEVDPVALHIHERISPQAIIKILKREDAQRDLFADPQLEYNKAIKFYEHDVDWANRMILGDSLQVMASLSKRENLAGQVQMIYMDPPYGIKFASNFQTEIGKRDVKDRETDLTREPEMIRAYRDTWKLGIHSYLSYMRDRLQLCKELLKDSGSIFVQISDENVHLLKNLLDDTFENKNYVALIFFSKTTGQAASLLPSSGDIILWYAKDISKIKYRPLYQLKNTSELASYNIIESVDTGEWRKMTPDEINDNLIIQKNWKIFSAQNLRSQGFSKNSTCIYRFSEQDYYCGENNHWKTTSDGLQRLTKSNRLIALGNNLNYKRYFSDFPVVSLNDRWLDTAIAGFSGEDKVFIVQTPQKVILRCILMTTDPGDLIIDPTCGSGTTAFVAEQFGRRWITIDTSRVAISLARQRILTSTFDFYRTKNGDGNNPATGFVYEEVPHITLKSIAQNVALDSIFAKHEPILETALQELNSSLKSVTKEERENFRYKLHSKEKAEGKKSITDADRRRWLLPDKGWKEWEVPFDTDEEYPEELKTALTNYRKLWRAKIDEVNACIQANAEMEELVDKPKIEKGITRVSGPFTVESVIPIEESLAEVAKYKETIEDELETFDVNDNVVDAINAETHIEKIIRLLQIDGVRFPNNKVLRFDQVQPVPGLLYLHAEGEWTTEQNEKRKVAISVGPEKGDVTSIQVEDALRSASRRGYDDLIFAGFNFDSAAQAIIQEDPNPKVRCHLAHIRPDLYMGDLLKDSPTSQIFTVFGSPRTELKQTKDGQFTIEMEGVDIYDPINNVLQPTNADKVAAWFLDTDYDGRTFCITQAFFPDKSVWEKIAKSLKGVIEKEQFEKLSGTVSLPFPIGKNKRAAVKVIDPRGNEVIKVHNLTGKY